MTDGARIQALIEIFSTCLARPEIPCDRILNSFLRERRFIGSKDRACIGDWFYALLRKWPFYEAHLGKPTPRLGVFLFCQDSLRWSLEKLQENANTPYSYAHPTSSERQALSALKEIREKGPTLGVPQWLYERFENSYGHETDDLIQALKQEASVDLRVNTLHITREAALAHLPKEAKLCTYSSLGIRCANRFPPNPLVEKGLVEIQDEGSQLIALLCDVHPGLKVFDMCAGAGGKTLALASLMQNKGRLIATDVIPWRLQRAQERLKKAKVSCVQTLVLENKWLKRHEGFFDRVLVDAPCSGTGTWRRHPEMAFRLSAQDLQELTEKQKEILKKAAPTVKLEGLMIYATCSVLKEENNDQAEAFLAEHPDFERLPTQEVWGKVLKSAYPTSNSDYLQLTPLHHKTDGFFVSVFRRIR